MCLAPEPNGTVTMFYRSWETMLANHADTAQAAIIASPTEFHLDQLAAAMRWDIPCYVEKPVCIKDDLEEFRALLERSPERAQARSTVGFQYRMHPHATEVAKIASSVSQIWFTGCDQLLARYGPVVCEAMLAHPLDTALRLYGPALSVQLRSNGVRVAGYINHGDGTSVSRYYFDMDSGPRQSWARSALRDVELEPSDRMYVDYLAAWLRQVTTGDRDLRLATLMDGLRVSEVLSRVQLVEMEPSYELSNQ